MHADLGWVKPKPDGLRTSNGPRSLRSMTVGPRIVRVQIASNSVSGPRAVFLLARTAPAGYQAVTPVYQSRPAQHEEGAGPVGQHRCGVRRLNSSRMDGKRRLIMTFLAPSHPPSNSVARPAGPKQETQNSQTGPRCSLAFVLILFSSIALLAQDGATFYVSTSGSDSNPGTLSQPWMTIEHA